MKSRRSIVMVVYGSGFPWRTVNSYWWQMVLQLMIRRRYQKKVTTGHIKRLDGILVAIQDTVPDGSRRRPGRPKRRWMDDIRSRISNHRYNLRDRRQLTTRSTALLWWWLVSYPFDIVQAEGAKIANFFGDN